MLQIHAIYLCPISIQYIVYIISTMFTLLNYINIADYVAKN